MDSEIGLQNLEKNLFWKFTSILQESTYTKLRSHLCQIEIIFSCKFAEYFQNAFSYKTPLHLCTFRTSSVDFRK